MKRLFRSFIGFLKNHKLHSVINVFGFAVSLMFVILIGLYIQDELRVDRQHVHADRIYRLEHAKGVTFGSPTAPALETRYPEVESTVRIWWCPNAQLYSPFMDQIYMGNAWYADSTLFDVFSFQFVEGDPHTALQSRDNVVLSESFARKLFGNRPALGQAIKVSKGMPSGYIVSGVIRDLDRTHFKPVDMIYTMANLRAGDRMFQMNFDAFGTRSYATYILTRPGADLTAKVSGMPDFFRELGDPLFERDATQTVRLVALRDIYLHQAIDDTGMFRGNNATFVLMLGLTALLILVFAMINYINLSVAQTEFRAKGAAIRLLLGETKERLFAGFMTESMLMCFVSLLIGLGLAYLAEPYFQQILRTSVSLSDGITAGNVALLFGTVFVVGAVSGVVPAMAISRYRPIDVVRGTLVRQSRMTFGKALIVFQYVIAMVLIGCTITIGRQVRYMQTQDLGFETRCILGMTNYWLVLAGGQDGTRSQLMAIPGVERVSFVRDYPTQQGEFEEWTLENGERMKIRRFEGDTAFLSMMNFEVLYRTGMDEADAVWLNETAWRRLGLAPEATEVPVNSQLKLKLKGRIRDFHFEDYTRPVGPVVISTLPSYERPYQILIQVSPGDPYGTRERIRLFNNERTGGDTFDGRFLDERIAAQYDQQRRMAGTIGTLSIVAIVLSALGMLAMATYYTKRREQEVAVRKVFGSTTGEVLLRVLGSFGKMVGVAFVVAIPIILQLMRSWLSGYAYRIDLSWTIFALSGAVALLIAIGSVFLQSLRTAHTNPVEVLKK